MQSTRAGDSYLDRSEYTRRDPIDFKVINGKARFVSRTRIVLEQSAPVLVSKSTAFPIHLYPITKIADKISRLEEKYKPKRKEVFNFYP